MRTMRAALLQASGQPLDVVSDVEIDDPVAGEVLVRVTHCGVCHSDLGIVDGHLPYPMPVVLGHEAAGVVHAVGAGVADIEPGERVVVSMRPPCGQCYFCMRNQPVLCLKAGSPASSPSTGEAAARSRLRWRGRDVTRGLRLAAFAEYLLVERSGVVRIPDGISNETASVMGCAVQTGLGSVDHIAKVRPGDSAVVIGLGGVGLSLVQGLQIAGAARIVGLDPMPERRDIAIAVGATHVLDSAVGDVAAQARASSGVYGADHVFDTVANTATTRVAAAACRPGGGIVLIGVPGRDVPLGLNAMDLVMHQRTVAGSFLGNCWAGRDIPRYFDLCCSGRLDLAALVTQQRPLEQINDALDDLRKGLGVRTVLNL